MTFLSISPEAQGMLTFWVSLTELLFFANLLRSVQIGEKRSNARSIVMCTAGLVFVQILFQQMDGVMHCPVVMPLWTLVLVILLLTCIACMEQYRLAVWNRTHISASSIKEALDFLPTGLCFALPEGLPLLVNETMERLSRLLFETPLSDACAMWEALRSGQGKGCIKDGSEPIYEMPDGKVYAFRREEMNLAEGTAYAVIAADITEEYARTGELEEKQKIAAVMNTRLKSLLGTIEYVAMSKELLQLKTAMHDNLGRSLLTARRYLQSPEAVDPKEMLSVWKRNLSHLIEETPEEWQIPYYVTKKEAASLGIDLQIIGDLPEEEALLPVLDLAVSTHMINVLRHADGHTAVIETGESEEAYRICFTNDGRLPSGKIRETGGLGTLRRQVELIGGRMEISTVPRFEMNLVLPKNTQNKKEETWAGKP